jgi:ParB/RepB/Spo0J family partition protein
MAIEFKVPHSRTGEYRVLPEHITINPELNGRYETPDIEWLITDMLAHGQHTPVVIRNDGGLCVLVAGFSRWRAVSEINKRGLTPVPMVLRCTAVKCNEVEAFLLNISENRFRNPTTPIDDAHNIKRLMKWGYTEDQISEVYFPTAKSEKELREARAFVNERITLIDLTPEAEQAVRAGRVTMPAAKAIAKLSTEQQKKVVEKEGTIERSDVVPAKPKVPKPPAKDAELLRRLGVMLEDVSGMITNPEIVNDPEFKYIEVERAHLISIYEYVEVLKAS